MTSKIFIALFLFSISVSTFAQNSTLEESLQTEILCSAQFPTRPEACTLVYNPVCASYPINCVTTPCPQTREFSNNCVACQDPNVNSYRPGSCDSDAVEEVEESALEEVVPSVPVEVEEPSSEETLPNAPEEVNESSLEENLQTEILCSAQFPTRPEVCTLIYNPVCASYPINCITTPCPQTQEFSNNCVACQDPNVNSYRPGPCDSNAAEEVEESALEEALPIIPEEEVLPITPEEEVKEPSLEENLQTEILCSAQFPTRPEACTFIYDPVCASYPINCVTTPCPQTQQFSNNCVACQDPNVSSYRPGPCDASEEVIIPGESAEELILGEESLLEIELGEGEANAFFNF